MRDSRLRTEENVDNHIRKRKALKLYERQKTEVDRKKDVLSCGSSEGDKGGLQSKINRSVTCCTEKSSRVD